MYRSIIVQVKPDSTLFEWCDRNAHCANNLYNAALFRERQLMFASLFFGTDTIRFFACLNVSA